MAEWIGPTSTHESNKPKKNTTDQIINRILISELNIDVTNLPEQRQTVINTINQAIEEAWGKGSLLFKIYSYSGRFGINPTKISEGHLLSILAEIAHSSKLPAEIAGCSLAVLAEQGIWRVTPQELGNSIFDILETDSPSHKSDSIEMTKSYLQALFNNAAQETIHIFDLDVRFTCFLSENESTIAYIIINGQELWLAMILATGLY
jgi:hypothetical protein